MTRENLKSEGTKVLSLNLSKENSKDYEQQVESFLTEGIGQVDQENEDYESRAIIFSGLKTDTRDKISEKLLTQWSLMSRKNSKFIFLITSEPAYDDLNSRFEIAGVEKKNLDLRDFTDKAKSHLGQYKENVLNIKEEGIYKHQGNEHKFAYILPKGFEKKNILTYKDYLPEDIVEYINLHRFYYHLNSSQIMCINFFYPLIKENLLDHVLRMLGIEGEADYCEFEKDSDVEGANTRKTKFDFFIKTKEGKNIYFEIKYTENRFGKAADDDDHSKKFKRDYEPHLNSTDVINPEYKTKEVFFENYQIIRNVMNINEDSYVVFIYPKENKKIRKGAKLAKDQIINKKWLDHFKPVLWETLVGEILNYVEDDKNLKEYYEKQFSKKYLL